MKCPLRNLSFKGEYDQDQYEDCDCLEKDCAWWDKEQNRCGVISIANALDSIDGSLTKW